MEPGTSSGPEAGQRSELPYIENGNLREYATWFKFQVIDECKRPGASVSIVARQHNINTNVVFRWRREIQLGLLRPVRPPQSGPFTAVGVIGEDGKLEPVPPAPAAATITLPPPVEAKPSSAKTLPVPAPPSPPPRSSASAASCALRCSMWSVLA